MTHKDFYIDKGSAYLSMTSGQNFFKTFPE